MHTIPCDLCGANDTQTLYVDSDWAGPLPAGLALVSCRQCGLMYLNPRPDPDEIGEYYPADYLPFRPAIEDEGRSLMRWFRRRKLSRRRTLIEHYTQQSSGRILDVGCATGLFLHEMALAGWQTAGVEPAESAADYARTRLGLEVFQGLLERSPYASGSFDVVTFWDVLEHTFSPRADLTHAAQHLRPGGLLVINIPNWHSWERRLFGAHWIGLDPPRHLYVFTRTTLTALLQQSGFVVLDWVCLMTSYFAFVVSLERWLNARSPRCARWASRLLNAPGVRLIFEPLFTLSSWLKQGGVISVFARKEEGIIR